MFSQLPTILSRMWKKLNHLIELPAGDIYRGQRAQSYLETRMKQPYWYLEEQALRDILRTFPDGLRVLDVPFGTGRFVHLYLEKKMSIYGVDASPDMFSVAKDVLGAEFAKCQLIVADACHLPYPSDFFDVVVSFRFLSHVISFSKAKQVIREISRVTKRYAVLQLRIRHERCRRVRRPFPWEPMSDRIPIEGVRTLLSSNKLMISDVTDLEDRQTYYRAVLLCQKFNSSNGRRSV